MAIQSGCNFLKVGYSPVCAGINATSIGVPLMGEPASSCMYQGFGHTCFFSSGEIIRVRYFFIYENCLTWVNAQVTVGAISEVSILLHRHTHNPHQMLILTKH